MSRIAKQKAEHDMMQDAVDPKAGNKEQKKGEIQLDINGNVASFGGYLLIMSLL